MRHKKMTERQRKILAAVGIIVFLVFCALVAYFIGRPMVALAKEPEQFRAWVDARGIGGRLLFVGMVVLQMLVAFIPGEPLEMGAGYAFGVFEGTLLCMAGILAGSALIFGFVRRFGVKVVEIFFSRDKIRSLKFLQNSRRLNAVTFLVMLLPGTPKDLLSYFIGLTDMNLSTWLIISAVARIPSVITSTISGGALGDQNYTLAIAALAVTAALSLTGIAIYRLIQRRHRTKSGNG